VVKLCGAEDIRTVGWGCREEEGELTDTKQPGKGGPWGEKGVVEVKTNLKGKKQAAEKFFRRSDGEKKGPRIKKIKKVGGCGQNTWGC